MPGDEISRPIHVIFNGDNFAQWSQAMRSYLKGRKNKLQSRSRLCCFLGYGIG